MNEEMEYAEMIEFPVSTVNVVQKRKKSKQPKADLQDKLIKKVNERMGENDGETSEKPTEKPAKVRAKKSATKQEFIFSDNTQNEAPVRESKGTRIALGIEFGLVCGLCSAIFLTNVFVPNSAINTFFKTITPEEKQAIDTRTYSDIELSKIVSENSSAQIEMSPTGVLTVSGASMIYSSCDGEILSVSQNESGTYDVEIKYTDSFKGTMTGLDYVYYGVGEKVYANVPMGYSDGQESIQVSYYSAEELLSCYALDEANCPTWVVSESES